MKYSNKSPGDVVHISCNLPLSKYKCLFHRNTYIIVYYSFIETAPKTDDGYEEFLFEDVAEEVWLNFRTYTWLCLITICSHVHHQTCIYVCVDNKSLMIVKYNAWSRIHGYLLILQHHIYTQDTPIDFLANHLWRIDGRLSVELISVIF